MSRRDNGLSAPSYVRLDDVATHLVDELLSRLRDAGVAAYSAPTPGRRGVYGETVHPLSPSDSVFVDSSQRDRARSITDTLLREVRDDLAWADIVAGFDTETAPDHEQPSPDSTDGRTDGGGTLSGNDVSAGSDTGPTIGFESLRAGMPTSPVVGDNKAWTDDGWVDRQLADDHFRPPPPPPVPHPDRINRFAWAGAIGGPVLLLLATLTGIPLDGWSGFLALAASMAGFVTLVARMKDRPSSDSDPDDGAVV